MLWRMWRNDVTEQGVHDDGLKDFADMKMDMLTEIIILHNGLPFDIKNPNEETQKALGELQIERGSVLKMWMSYLLIWMHKMDDTILELAWGEQKLV